MLFVWIAAALAGECRLVASVDADGQLSLVDRGTCPPNTYIALKNSLGQDQPLDLPEYTLIELPVSLTDGAAFVAPASRGVLIGGTLREGPDVSHLAQRVPDLPTDCSVIADVDASGRVESVRPMECTVADWRVARRKATRARFAQSPSGGHAVLPASDPDGVREAVVELEVPVTDVP
ncbi:MAG: hypothetical protein GY913_16040 [Proteobacteria bacterium]|nr:hypothetical protein [Pseudomonadota bacterium]MCP4918416.1 hypothetical protein [Pseudomonadota bacterium]